MNRPLVSAFVALMAGLAIVNCAPPPPPPPPPPTPTPALTQVRLDFPQSPLLFVGAVESAAPECPGTPKRLSFNVTVRAALIPQDGAPPPVTYITDPSAEFSIRQAERTLPAGDTSLSLFFTPQEIGPRRGTFKVDAASFGANTLNLLGLGTCQGIDTDGDGLRDIAERRTDPTKADTDGDGILDGFEDRNRNGRVDPGESDPANMDTDGDGIPDGVEDANKDGNPEGRPDPGESDPRNPNSP